MVIAWLRQSELKVLRLRCLRRAKKNMWMNFILDFFFFATGSLYIARLACNLSSSYLSFPSARITGMYHHA
jgi:hypothetical protein